MSFPFFPAAGLRLGIGLTCTFISFCLSAQNAVPSVRIFPTGGLYSEPTQVVLSNALSNAVLYYTLDGSIPNTNALVYTSPLSIDASTVLRVRAFAPGLAPSPTTTQSYFIGLKHQFPVVSLAFPPPAFFDPLSGIYPNYTNGLSVVSNLEFFENGGDTAVVNQLVEVELQGTGSLVLPQKSLEIKAKKSLGEAEVNYPLFPDLPYNSYKRFVLRNSGQDWCVLQFRDEFATSLVGDLSDLGGSLSPPHLFLQAWRPAVVYLNGQYWGIHNVRERMTQFYVRQHLGWDDDEYDLIENFNEVSIGDSIAWFQFVDFLQRRDFSSAASFTELKQRIDYQNYLDYCVYNVYMENEDWPGNNVRRFRHRSPAGKWQWMTYDLDFTFGLYQANGGWNTGDASPNALARLLDSTSVAWPNPEWSTLLFRRCWQNAAFRQDFANRMADMLNTNLSPQRVSKRIDQFRALYEPEIAAHYDRWWGAYLPELWTDNIDKVRSFAKRRPGYVYEEIAAAWPEADHLVAFTVDVSPRQAGALKVSTVQPDNTQAPWTGTYFRDVAVPVKAIARPGFHFAGWSDPALGAADSIQVLPPANRHLVAYFEADDREDSPDTVNNLEISVALNSATGTLRVSNPLMAQQGFQLQVVDALGRVVLQRSYPAQAEGILSLETGDLGPGTYFLRVTLAGTGLTGTKAFGKI